MTETGTLPRIRVPYAALSDPGLVRSHNEDRCAARPPLFLVADGMGGQAAGEVAAQLVVDELLAAVDRDELRGGESVAAAVRRANQEVRRRASLEPSLRGMGTTCTAVLVLDAKAHVVHVGDSRAYLLRDSELIPLTNDHTAVDRLRREGILTDEQAEVHPDRHILSRAIGAHDTLEIDLTVVTLRHDDRLLLCSDGLTGMISGPEVVRALAVTASPDAAAGALVRAALAAGGEDNVTVIVVDPMLLPARTSDVPAAPATTDRPLRVAPESVRRSTSLTVAAAIGLIVLILVAMIGIMASRSGSAPSTTSPPSAVSESVAPPSTSGDKGEPGGASPAPDEKPALSPVATPVAAPPIGP